MSDSTRINKFLSQAGFCSRREADEFIKMGLVHVNLFLGDMNLYLIRVQLLLSVTMDILQMHMLMF